MMERHLASREGRFREETHKGREVRKNGEGGLGVQNWCKVAVRERAGKAG